ncbi:MULTISPECIES: Gfo/Idh/MocA family oxidoreductase [Cyanophyceae]|uniref:Gfo/Idh/MocA family protein n=1 Tax=Cyanophyceae TaxID=3028117 RepID=UPI001685239E|nr:MULTISPECIES: Gfo/Idh/MocA family oxidoreductase [Cyanophyceae]MBD1917729.1 Gfo/Idh/MocA family oxidoreductase [Phormidium sp. FACHB-77]MBD2032848.1 Gfo/Idh/MocA family oxidoreductase [Phormidium sp. FACHB-322]MBD2051595.1 Gfo/Idh/MocA family oxidoreductase [Leptolyngbya sp. FACHB-60]
MSPPHPLNLAIFGLGRWGSHLLRNFLALPAARVVAIADPDRQRLDELRDRFALGDTVTCYDDWLQAMAHPGLEAVVIATPASTHYPMIQAALTAGLHVLSEKPLTLDSNRSAALCQLAATQQRQLMVDHTYLFHPAVQRGRELCQQIGALRYGYAARTNLGPVRSDADVFWDLAIHDVSILNYWLGQSPLAVAAWGAVWLQTEAEAKLRDVGWLRLVYANPVSYTPLEVIVHVSWANPDRQRRLALVGDRGTLVFDESPQAHPLTLYAGHFQSQEPPFVPSSPRVEAVTIAPLEPLQQMCVHFLDCVANNTPSPISAGAMAADLVKIVEAIAIAAETGQQVDI